MAGSWSLFCNMVKAKDHVRVIMLGCWLERSLGCWITRIGEERVIEVFDTSEAHRPTHLTGVFFSTPRKGGEVHNNAKA